MHVTDLQRELEVQRNTINVADRQKVLTLVLVRLVNTLTFNLIIMFRILCCNVKIL